MRVRVADLLPESGRAQEIHLSVPLVPPETGLSFAAPAEAALRLERAGDLIRVGGDVQVGADGSCDRCLAPVRLPLRVAVDESLSLAEPADRAEVVLDEAAFVVPIGESGDLDLADLVRECVIAALPMQVLCREDCRGLCPTCGANLNETDCGHTGRPPDPRLAALGTLLDRLEE